MKWRMYVSTTHIFCLYMLSDTEMNRQQGSCIHSLMEMEMSFAFCTVVRSPSIVASCIGVVINSQMISHTSLISNETFDRTYNDNCCFSFFFVCCILDTIYSIGNNMVVRLRQQQIRLMPMADRFEYWQMIKEKKSAYICVFLRIISTIGK